MSYPEYVLWPHDDELWIHSGGGIYRSLDSVYTREYGDVVDPRMSPIRLAAVSDVTDRDVLEEARERTATAQAERDAALAAGERVRALAEGWLTEPCVGGYRITNGNDDDSQCLHCAADVLLEALDGGEQ